MVTVLQNKNEFRRATSLLFLFLWIDLFLSCRLLLRAPCCGGTLLGSRICALRPLSQTAVTFLPLVYSTKPRIINFGIPLNDYYQIRFTYVTSKTLPETSKLIIHKWNLIKWGFVRIPHGAV